jgi:hypothetical protein
MQIDISTGIVCSSLFNNHTEVLGVANVVFNLSGAGSKFYAGFDNNSSPLA